MQIWVFNIFFCLKIRKIIDYSAYSNGFPVRLTYVHGDFIGIVSSFISTYHCFPLFSIKILPQSWFHAITEATRLANIVCHRLGNDMWHQNRTMQRAPCNAHGCEAHRWLSSVGLQSIHTQRGYRFFACFGSQLSESFFCLMFDIETKILVFWACHGC